MSLLHIGSLTEMLSSSGGCDCRGWGNNRRFDGRRKNTSSRKDKSIQ